MSNLYYDPQEFGLDQITGLDEAGLDYEFHMLLIWRDLKSGEIVWGEDSGCSCPAPFESHHFKSISETSLNVGTDGLKSAILSFPASDEDKELAFNRLKKAKVKFPKEPRKSKSGK